MTDGAQLV
ncbi:hypothetical protein AGR4A_Lc40916 [Agrobacterium tumefaciens str. B6]|uniref:Uncharacterized protein n=1 Tax=Agrobacterium tumefaciens str. B6 TaxID=1183423 RepID=A0A822VAA9_AGRTU|nr:hypothetical protein AGR4B_Lc30006 [Agrobacterium tumefaciens str. CFBP 5621]CVI23402.1 hypothetical protein AGR4A_Lc40916 [Agrobacterium tumefaciens str. B6]